MLLILFEIIGKNGHIVIKMLQCANVCVDKPIQNGYISNF